MKRRTSAAAALALFLVPLLSHASGFNFGENGTRALSLGGAFAAVADDLTAIQHNPAGLTQLQGWHLLLEGNARLHEVTFQRRDAGSDRASPAELVRNDGGTFLTPFIAAGYGRLVGGRRLTVALGAYGPPTVGRYAYPEPNYATDGNRFQADPRKFAPQRYGLINNDLIILYPSVSVAYEVHPRFAVGASLQYVYTSIHFRQAVTSSFATPKTQFEESAELDSVVTVDQQGKPTVTAILGLMVRPTDNVQVGLSYRPPVPVETTGTMELQLGELTDQLADIQGDRASFKLTLPQELKLGVQVKPMQRLLLTGEAVYQGWQSFSEWVLVPENITRTVNGGEPQKVDPIRIPKQWRHAWSGRFGAQYAFDFGLNVRAGVLYEQSGIPDEYANIDFLHFDRTFGTVGLDYAFPNVIVSTAFAYTLPQTKEITASDVRQSNTDNAIPGAVIGNGTYSSGGWIFSFGLRGRFGS